MDDEVKSLQSRLENQEIEAKALAYLHGQVVDERDALRAQNGELLAALKAGYDDMYPRNVQLAIATFGMTADKAAEYVDAALPSLVEMRAAIAKATQGGRPMTPPTPEQQALAAHAIQSICRHCRDNQITKNAVRLLQWEADALAAVAEYGLAVLAQEENADGQ